MIDLTRFCSTDEDRPALLQPFTLQGATWATDGVILLRVGLRGDVPEVSDLRAVLKILACHEGATFSPLPRVNWSEVLIHDVCSNCEGRGFEHDCPSCGCKRTDCGGTGRELFDIRVSVRGVTFDSRCIRLIETLPNVEFAVSPK